MINLSISFIPVLEQQHKNINRLFKWKKLFKCAPSSFTMRLLEPTAIYDVTLLVLQSSFEKVNRIAANNWWNVSR